MSKSRNSYKFRHDIINYVKTNPCMDCHGTFPPVCMEFDHRDESTKLGSVSSRIGGWDMFLAELEKCDVVCANCHNIRTATRLGGLPGKGGTPNRGPKKVVSE